MAKSIVGDPVGRRGIIYAPTNKAGVLMLFARLLDEFDMLIEETADDCGYVIARRRVDVGWERVKISLSYKSSDFGDGSSDDVDLLICWRHDWPECPIKAFELKALFENEREDNNPGPGKVPAPSEDDPENHSISNILPRDSSDLLENRGIRRERFEKAIGDLDEKIKKIFPDKT